jgi:hypothetical protein
MQRTQVANQATQANNTNPTIPTSLTGDTISGDILTATIWGYYAAVQSHGELAKRQANMVDRPGMSYGLFHAKVQPVKTFGIVTTAVKFPGVEMDIGHLRHLRWAKSNQQNEWVAYNRIRGQYASALEHATPERFFVDTTTCNLPTSTPTSTPPYDAAKPACAEGISAVKALAVAQSQGQKVFLINASNYANLLPQLNQSQQIVDDIRNAVLSGKEVMIHQARITYSGWSGTGYIASDSATGAGSYLIDGKANGGVLTRVGNNSDELGVAFFGLGILSLIGVALGGGIFVPFLLAFVALTISTIAFAAAQIQAVENAECPAALPCINDIFKRVFVANLLITLVASVANPAYAIALAFTALVWGDSAAAAAASACNPLACRRA